MNTFCVLVISHIYIGKQFYYIYDLHYSFTINLIKFHLSLFYRTTNSPLRAEITELSTAVWVRKEVVLAPQKLVDIIIERSNGLFTKYQQEDASELLLFLLTTLHTELMTRLSIVSKLL